MIEICEGGGLSVERPPPSRSLPERRGMGERWGRGRFSERSASPPDPLSRRAAGNRLGSSFGGSRPCEVGAFPCFGVVVTAADRAAATCQHRVSYKLGGSGEGFQRAIAKPFGASADAASRLLPQKELSCAFARMAEDTPLPVSADAQQDIHKQGSGPLPYLEAALSFYYAIQMLSALRSSSAMGARWALLRWMLCSVLTQCCCWRCFHRPANWLSAAMTVFTITLQIISGRVRI